MLFCRPVSEQTMSFYTESLKSSKALGTFVEQTFLCSDLQSLPGIEYYKLYAFSHISEGGYKFVITKTSDSFKTNASKINASFSIFFWIARIKCQNWHMPTACQIFDICLTCFKYITLYFNWSIERSFENERTFDSLLVLLPWIFKKLNCLTNIGI